MKAAAAAICLCFPILVLLLISSSPIAAQGAKIWQFHESNDPSNKGRLTARLTYGVPETDDIQVQGVCDGSPSTGAKFSNVVFGSPVGQLASGQQAELRFTGEGFSRSLQGRVVGVGCENAIAGVSVDVEHSDALWQAFLQQDVLDYFVPGYRVNTIDL